VLLEMTQEKEMKNNFKLKVIENNITLSKNTYVGSVSFSLLEKIARITTREVNNSDDDYEWLYQRQTDWNKIKKIVKFIEITLFKKNLIDKRNREDVVSLFPTAMIISFDADIVEYNKNESIKNKNEKEEEDSEKEKTIKLLKGVNSDSYIYFPSQMKKDVFIVDGQHRFIGVKEFFKKNKHLKDNVDIQFPVTVLVNYTQYEQAKVFGTVNFEQKPVNRSLYYDIFGDMPGERNELTLSHFLAKYLNEDQGSPFCGMIKMLGVGETGIFSQAFLVQKLKPLFGGLRKDKIFSKYFEEYHNGNDKAFENILNILVVYFKVIQEKFKLFSPQKNEDGKYYYKEYKHILFKTTGMGALLKLLNDFTEEVSICKDSDKKLEEFFNSIFFLFDPQETKNLFSKNGDFAKGAGSGLQSRLYKTLSELIKYKRNVIGKKHDNADIVDIQKIELNGKIFNELTLNNGTKTRLSDEEIDKIRKNNS